jgi:hypothetical protein
VAGVVLAGLLAYLVNISQRRSQSRG